MRKNCFHQTSQPVKFDDPISNGEVCWTREHTAMVRLLWAEQSVPEKIAALKKKAEKAYEHLMKSKVSEYKTFISEAAPRGCF